jgi:hypothetical protein
MRINDTAIVVAGNDRPWRELTKLFNRTVIVLAPAEKQLRT